MVPIKLFEKEYQKLKLKLKVLTNQGRIDCVTTWRCWGGRGLRGGGGGGGGRLLSCRDFGRFGNRGERFGGVFSRRTRRRNGRRRLGLTPFWRKARRSVLGRSL